MADGDKTEVVARLTPAQGVPTIVEAKPGSATSEFKALVGVFLMAVAEEVRRWVDGGLQGPPWGVIAAAVATGAFAIGRSIVKRPPSAL